MANTTTNPFAGFLATITTQVVNHGPTRPSRDSSDHSKYLTRAHRGPYEEGFNIRYGTEEAKLDALLDDAETSKWDRCRYTRRLQTLAKELEATEDVFDNIKQGARMYVWTASQEGFWVDCWGRERLTYKSTGKRTMLGKSEIGRGWRGRMRSGRRIN